MRHSHGYHNKLPDLTVSPVVHLDTLGHLVDKISTHTAVQICGPTSIFGFPSHLVWFDILRQSHSDIHTVQACISHGLTLYHTCTHNRDCLCGFTAWIGKCTEQQSIYMQLAPFYAPLLLFSCSCSSQDHLHPSISLPFISPTNIP